MDDILEQEQAGPIAQIRARLLVAALQHVVFDGWSDKSLAMAARDIDIPLQDARQIFPRGGVDMALAFHNDRDAAMVAKLEEINLAGMRFREQVAHAVMMRLELVADHREEVRRAVALFALPPYAADGARAIWHTSDCIWTVLGDTSRDYNWYTKRMTLSGVYSSALLYWLGDDSEDHARTREFVARRIENVMQFEKLKAGILKAPIAGPLLKMPLQVLDRLVSKGDTLPSELPGSLRDKV